MQSMQARSPTHATPHTTNRYSQTMKLQPLYQGTRASSAAQTAHRQHWPLQLPPAWLGCALVHAAQGSDSPSVWQHCCLQDTQEHNSITTHGAKDSADKRIRYGTASCVCHTPVPTTVHTLTYAACVHRHDARQCLPRCAAAAVAHDSKLHTQLYSILAQSPAISILTCSLLPKSASRCSPLSDHCQSPS